MSLTQLLGYTSDGFPPFKDEADYLTISYKRRVLSDWTIFIYGGFKKMLFTPTLYRFLINHCIFLPLLDQESFWKYYFNSDVFHLRVFLNQFGGNLLSAGFATISWLGGPGSDLKGAMCLEMYPIYPALTALLNRLEENHMHIQKLWQNFSVTANLQGNAVPSRFTITDMCYNLFAYTAQQNISGSISMPTKRG